MCAVGFVICQDSDEICLVRMKSVPEQTLDSTRHLSSDNNMMNIVELVGEQLTALTILGF